MKAVVQKVSSAKVTIDNKIYSEIRSGLLVFIAFNYSDDFNKIKWMVNKLVNLRVFPDDEDKMNKSVLDNNGSILLVSNFTLYGNALKGFRPSFIEAAPPEISEPLYLQMLKYMNENYPIKVESGIFGAMMEIELINNGPVTIIIEK